MADNFGSGMDPYGLQPRPTFQPQFPPIYNLNQFGATPPPPFGTEESYGLGYFPTPRAQPPYNYPFPNPRIPQLAENMYGGQLSFPPPLLPPLSQWMSRMYPQGPDPGTGMYLPDPVSPRHPGPPPPPPPQYSYDPRSVPPPRSPPPPVY